MKIDFHVHGKISGSFPFDTEKFLVTINEAKEAGLDSIALTEHCHANNFFEGYNFLNNNYELKGEYYNVDDFKVFYGMEVTTAQELDIIIIGKPMDIIELRNQISKNFDFKKFIDINELFEKVNENKFLIILAHPYRKHDQFPDIKNNVFQKIDAIEFNATDLYDKGIEEMKNKVSKLANKFDIPVVCGSDTHYFIQMSSIKNILKKDCITVKEIKEEIKLKNYKTELSPDLKVRVKSAKIIKKLIKEINNK